LVDEKIVRTCFLFGVMSLLTTCNKPVCPVPKIIPLNVPEVKVSSCTTTSPPLQITSCVQRLMTGVNKILYVRHNPGEGITHNMCPDPIQWKPYEIISNQLNYQLFFPVDEWFRYSDASFVLYFYG
jgi:hypothetical protein